MEMNLPQAPIMDDSSTGGISNKVIIVVLATLLILSFLGINLLTMFGGLIDTVISILGPFVSQVLSIFGYTTGSVINKSSHLSVRQQTLLHEVFEAINEIHELDLDHYKIKTLTAAMFQILMDNKDLFEKV